jgi:hypothetical protein
VYDFLENVIMDHRRPQELLPEAENHPCRALVWFGDDETLVEYREHPGEQLDCV